MWRMLKNVTERATSAVILDGEISNHVGVLLGGSQGCMVSTHLFKVCIKHMIVAVEAAKQGVPVGEDTVSGSMFADDLVEIWETPEGLQKHVAKALEYTSNFAIQSGGSNFGTKGGTTPFDKSYLQNLSGPVSCGDLPEKARQDTRKEKNTSDHPARPPYIGYFVIIGVTL